MNVLIILDPLKKLNPEWDNSLAVAAELIRRGHKIWTADAPDLRIENRKVLAHAKPLFYFPGKPFKSLFKNGPAKTLDLAAMGLILVRKEPPVNEDFIHMTYLVELVSNKVPVVNNPAGIRNNNEKLSILNFPKWIAPTLVSADLKEILRFRKKHREIVIKPLNEKGGKDVFILKSGSHLKKLQTLLRKGMPVMAQKRMLFKTEKRIVILNGKFLCAYGKKPVGKEWRANLDLGADFFHCSLSAKEKRLLKELRPFLLREGLYFTGLDVLNGKLIEINVTCPAGATESAKVFPRSKPVSAWADFLEQFASS